MKRRIAVCLLASIAAACGGSPSGSTSEASPVGPARAEEVTDACALLTEDVVHELFAVGNTAVAVKPGRFSPHPTCTAHWRKPNADELEAELPQRMQEYLAAKARGEEVEMPVLTTTNEVSLTVVEGPFASEEEAASAFQGMLRSLEEGISAEADAGGERREVSLCTELEEVRRVGSEAAWSPELSQLSVRDGRWVFHVGVKVAEEEAENRRLAVELARYFAEVL